MCAEQRRHMQGFLDEQCAACYPHCDSVCMDGNMKLYTMSNTHEPHRTMYAGFDHGNGIFVPEAEVMKHMNELDTACPNLKQQVCIAQAECMFLRIYEWHRCKYDAAAHLRVAHVGVHRLGP
jgi:hypothetical protein